MRTGTDGQRGVRTYVAVAIACSTAMSLVFYATGLSIHNATMDRRVLALVIATMWIPALARAVATYTVDDKWPSPFPVRRWGYPGVLIVIVPLTAVCAVYAGSHVLATWLAVPRKPPVWQGEEAVAKVAASLPMLVGIGLLGALGEEVGWRGYLQPRLDQLAVRGSMLAVILAETLFHMPLILWAGYLPTETSVKSIALFLGLKLGATPVWTWATYRWRSIWMAAWFHTIHNALALALIPNLLGVGHPLVLGEFGIIPVGLYLIVAAAVFGFMRARGDGWSHFAKRALNERDVPAAV
jgi:membrane protease YdiL (CAAX protease family)